MTTTKINCDSAAGINDYLEIAECGVGDDDLLITPVIDGRRNTSIFVKHGEKQKQLIEAIAGEPVILRSELVDALSPISVGPGLTLTHMVRQSNSLRGTTFQTALIDIIRLTNPPKPESPAQAKIRELQETIDKAQKELGELKKEVL